MAMGARKIYLYSKMKKILSISVMAHHSRKEFFPYLKEKLGDVPFSVDEHNEGPWNNAKKAWAMFDTEAKYHVVIQDDAIICNDFMKRAEDILMGSKAEAFSFYFGDRSPLKRLADRGMQDGFIELKGLHWGVAICLSTKLIPYMLKY